MKVITIYRAGKQSNRTGFEQLEVEWSSSKFSQISIYLAVCIVCISLHAVVQQIDLNGLEPHTLLNERERERGSVWVREMRELVCEREMLEVVVVSMNVLPTHLSLSLCYIHSQLYKVPFVNIINPLLLITYNVKKSDSTSMTIILTNNK